MSDLPLVSMTDEQKERIYAAYKGKYDVETIEEIEDVIRFEFVSAVNATVVNYEGEQLREEMQEQLQTQLGSLSEGLPEAPSVRGAGPFPGAPGYVV